MADWQSEAVWKPKVVFDPAVVLGHVLPTPSLVVEHILELLKVPFVWDEVDEGVVDGATAETLRARIPGLDVAVLGSLGIMVDVVVEGAAVQGD